MPLSKEQLVFYKTVLGILQQHKSNIRKSDHKKLINLQEEIDIDKSRIKSNASKYRKNLEVIKFLKTHEKALPEGLIHHLTQVLYDSEETKANLIQRVYNTKRWKEEISTIVNKPKKKQRDVKPIIEQEFERVSGLIEDGVIESITFNPSHGIELVFPPRILNTNFFTGRIKVTIHDTTKCGYRDNCCIFQFNTISYDRGDVNDRYFSWHARNSPVCRGFCLGTFEDIIYEAIDNKILSQIIVLLSAYLDSSDEASGMTIDGPSRLFWVDPKHDPSVIDDSWKEFKKTDAYKDWLEETKNKEYKKPEEDEEDEDDE